jgi:hypothetical protein
MTSRKPVLSGIEIVDESSAQRCFGPDCPEPAAYRFLFDDRLSVWLCPACAFASERDTHPPAGAPGS